MDVSYLGIVSCVWFSIASSCATRVVQEGKSLFDSMGILSADLEYEAFLYILFFLTIFIALHDTSFKILNTTNISYNTHNTNHNNYIYNVNNTYYT